MTLKHDLAYDALCSDKFLTPQERFFIVESIKSCRQNIGPLATLYLECGYIEKAMPLLKKIGDWRGIGECYLILGDKKKALEYFQKPAKGRKEAGRYRYEPDYDFIIRLLFIRKDWSGVIEAFKEAKIRYATGNLIVLHSAAVNGKPWLKILTIAMIQYPNSLNDKDWRKYVLKAFKISDAEFQKTLNWAASLQAHELEEEIKNSMPSILSLKKNEYDEIIALGKTEKAEKLLEWIESTSSSLKKIQNAIQRWLNLEDEEALKYAVSVITGSNIRSMTKSIFFEVTNRTNALEGPPERIIEFYKTHEDIFRICFSHCLELQIRDGGQISSQDVLTSVFQYVAFPINIDEVETLNFSLKKLVTCEDWALIKLEKWKLDIGREFVAAAETEVIQGTKFSDIRKLNAWKHMSKGATFWLNEEWVKEISISPWVSENLLYSILKEKFSSTEVIQHANPAWLSPQHLDIYIPEYALAIEYMGLQHYEPIEIFGGEAGYIQTIERDKRKQEVCHRVGVRLIYVRYDQDISIAAQEIASEYKQAPI